MNDDSFILDTEDLSNVLGALGNNKRLMILDSLMEGQSTFSELQKVSGLGKTALSHHMSILREASLVDHSARGIYVLSRDGFEMLRAIIETYQTSMRIREIEARRRLDYLRKMHMRKPELSKIDVKIMRMEPMRVASFHAFGESPENDAVEKLITWAQPLGLLNNPDGHPVYGFNNPNPEEGKKEYGYEFWIKIDENYNEKETVYKTYGGGTYAVTRVEVREPWEDIPKAWMNLLKWVQDNGYTMKQDVCLEHTLDPKAVNGQFILDLMLPIEK